MLKNVECLCVRVCMYVAFITCMYIIYYVACSVHTYIFMKKLVRACVYVCIAYSVHLYLCMNILKKR